MAERVVIVCDVCGEPARERVSIRSGGKAYQKDLCPTHRAELLHGASAARRGRRPAGLGGGAKAPTTARRRGRPPKAAPGATSAPKRRGRPPKVASANA